MKSGGYRSLPSSFPVGRRSFLKVGGAVGAGVLLGNPSAWAEEKSAEKARVATNIAEALSVPRTRLSLPGLFPGRVVQASDPGALRDDRPAPEIVEGMFRRGIRALTGADERKSFDLLFTKNDVVGIKVNPVGAGIISTRLETVDAIVGWLTACGLPRERIVIWDRFDGMLREAGFTGERYPGIGIEGLQTIDEELSEESEDDSRWRDAEGNHLSAGNFDPEVYYFADVDGPSGDRQYLNQHVFAGKYSYYGKLLTKKLTKIINVPVFKNTGNGVSMATKNIGYAAICNTGRLHQALFFDVCTEVLAFPVIRDKMVLSVIDGLKGQYDGGPMPVAANVYAYNSLFLATDPFALDMTGQRLMVEKRKSAGIQVNEHPKYTEYLRYAEKLGLGIADPARIEVQHA